MKTANELSNALTQFTGTEGYTRWSPLFRNFVLTDGALFLAKEAGAYWLMDAIASHMSGYKDTFATAKLTQWGKGWVLTLDDGNGDVFATQQIEYSDFPLDEIMLFMGRQDDLWVIMLPSEY